MLPKALTGLMVLVCVISLAACAGTGGGSSSRNGKDNATNKRDAAEVQVRLGRGYMEKGKFEIALGKLKRAVEIDPRYPTAHTMLAVLYEQIGDADNARAHYKRSVDLAPKEGSILNNYGRWLCSNGGSIESIEYFERAIADPFYRTPDLALSNAGTCALQGGQPERAEGLLRKALEKNPENATALIMMASIMHERADNFRASAFIQRYQSVAPATAESLDLGMRIELALGNAGEAAEYKQALLSGFSDSPQARKLRESEDE